METFFRLRDLFATLADRQRELDFTKEDLIRGLNRNSEYYNDDGDILIAPRDNYLDQNVIRTLRDAIEVIEQDILDLVSEICSLL